MLSPDWDRRKKGEKKHEIKARADCPKKGGPAKGTVEKNVGKWLNGANPEGWEKDVKKKKRL